MVTWLFRALIVRLDGLAALLGKILAALEKLRRPVKPGLLWIRVTGESGQMLKFNFTLPPAGAPDVKERELSVQIAGSEPQTVKLPGDAIESGEYSGNDNDPVRASLVDIDDAGNRSEPSVGDFILTDTISPPQPGAIGLRVTSEE